jgi:hypothetical protein
LAEIRAAGVTAPMLTLSNVTREGIDGLRRALLPAKTYCFVGSSGVGKSTIHICRCAGNKQATPSVFAIDLKQLRIRRDTLFRKHLPLFAGMVLVLVAAAGCVPVATSTAVQGATGGPVTPVIRTEPAATALPAGLRPIPVSNVTVDVGVGSPIPVDAFVSGEWPDLCAQLAQITQRFQGKTFEITLLATAGDPACPPDHLGLPFRIAIPINVVQLPEGTYTVTANGATTTFTVPVTPTSPAAQPPALEAPVEPPATPAPAATDSASAGAAVPEPTASGPGRYRGPNPYRATPAFEVAYDPALWQYVEDDGSGRQSQLKHTSLPGCAVWLRAGPVGATPVATVWLAGRAWTLAQVQPNIIQYSSSQGDISWIFGVLLPETYSGRGNSNCQDAAEQVIDTFKVLAQ